MSEECLDDKSKVVQPHMEGESHTMRSDALLLECLRIGQATAFDALFRRHYQRIYQVLYRLVGDEAEDLAQEVFLRLYRRPPRASDSDVGAWLYRVATHLGYNALRSKGRRELYRDILGAVTGGLGWRRAETYPEAALEGKEERYQVRAVLRRLKKRQATILVLRYSGLSYREMADVLGIAPGSVGTLLARAEHAFRLAYEQRIDRGGRYGGGR